MIVKSLRLRNFRNYEKAEIHFQKGMNILIGKNAQGKTNVLESLIYLSLTRSHRINDDKKLIRQDCPFADIRCVFEDDREKEIEAVIHPNGKTLLVYRQPVKKSSEFIGLLNVILFAPDDLRIFTDQPRERRRIMNQEITKVSLDYLFSLNRFQNIMKDRNILLKQINPDLLYLDLLDEQMAKEEKKIIERRKQFVSVINENIGRYYHEISGEQDHVEVFYKCFLETDDVQESIILEKHRQAREKDMDYHVTGVGIHHEDLIFQMNHMNLTHIASQGQKRLVMLAFKLSLMTYIEQMTGKKPVFLLDDVLSELDRTKQMKLLQMVSKKYQCMVTATEIPEYLRQIPMKVMHVENGMIRE